MKLSNKNDDKKLKVSTDADWAENKISVGETSAGSTRNFFWLFCCDFNTMVLVDRSKRQKIELAWSCKKQTAVVEKISAIEFRCDVTWRDIRKWFNLANLYSIIRCGTTHITSLLNSNYIRFYLFWLLLKFHHFFRCYKKRRHNWRWWSG